MNDGKKEAGPAALVSVRRRGAAPVSPFSRCYLLLKLCAVLLVLVLVLVLVFVGITIYHKAKHPEVLCQSRFLHVILTTSLL